MILLKVTKKQGSQLKKRSKNIFMESKYGVFIIESLRSTDFCDGDSLNEILKLSQINSIYRWVECKEGLINAINEFKKSEYRYLHFSFHADYLRIELTNEGLSNSEFARILGNSLKNKRVFFSSCKGGNRELAVKLISNGVYSSIGTPNNIRFDKAALFCPSFYHIINEHNIDTIKKSDLNVVLKGCSKLFKVPINYYSFIKTQRNSKIRRIKIRNGLIVDNRVLNI